MIRSLQLLIRNNILVIRWNVGFPDGRIYQDLKLRKKAQQQQFKSGQKVAENLRKACKSFKMTQRVKGRQHTCDTFKLLLLLQELFRCMRTNMIIQRKPING